MVRAWEFNETRFVGTLEQWTLFSAINGLDFHNSFQDKPRAEERAQWRKLSGQWFVVPTKAFSGDARHRESDGSEIAAEVASDGTSVAIYRDPDSDRVETLGMLDPDAADALGRQLMRMAMVARARRAEEAIENNVDESMWQEGGG